MAWRDDVDVGRSGHVEAATDHHIVCALRAADQSKQTNQKSKNEVSVHKKNL